MSALILLISTFLQPSNLEGCGTIPRPRCESPDIPAISWERSGQRVYAWPLEDDGLAVTYHRQPDIYGVPPFGGAGQTHYCLIDEAENTADCYSRWEYQTIATCSTDRYRWIGSTIRPAPQPPFLYREDPLDYWFHRGHVQVYLWEWKQRFGTFPNVGGPNTPRPDITFQASRTQVFRGGPTTFFFTQAVFFIREDGRLFSSGFDFNAGFTGQLPTSTSEGRACSSLYIGVTNWCDFAPNRPECR